MKPLPLLILFLVVVLAVMFGGTVVIGSILRAIGVPEVPRLIALGLWGGLVGFTAVRLLLHR